MDSTWFDKKSENWDAKAERLQRAEKIYRRMAEQIEISSDSEVLDFGCGTGLLGFNFIKNVKSVTFADTSAGMLEQIVKKAASAGCANYKIINLSGEVLSGGYDAAVSLMALHHVENPAQTVKNLAEHLVKGGYICLSDLDTEDGSFHYPQVAPHNGIKRAAVLESLAASSVKIICNETVHTETKTVDGKLREYTVFLIIGKKE